MTTATVTAVTVADESVPAAVEPAVVAAAVMAVTSVVSPLAAAVRLVSTRVSSDWGEGGERVSVCVCMRGRSRAKGEERRVREGRR